MGHLMLSDGQTIRLRVLAQTFEDVIRVGVTDPLPATVHPIHHRPKVQTHVLHAGPRRTRG